MTADNRAGFETFAGHGDVRQQVPAHAIHDHPMF